jgi:hypothetical protein
MIHSSILSRALFFPLLAAAALLLNAQTASAQTPKAGKYEFQDDVDLGFKIKSPKDWDYIPPQPDENQLVGKFTPRLNKHYTLSGGDYLFLDAFLVKFDRRESDSKRAYDYDEALDKYADRCFNGVSSVRRSETKDLKVDKVPSKEVLYTARTRGGSDVHVYAMQYFFSEDLVVAYLFVGPADKKKWRKWESVYKTLGKSMRRLEIKEIDVGETKEGDSAYRSSKRAALIKDMRAKPGWQLVETENYFIVTSSDDRGFLRELEMRLEAIRKVYGETYPVADAQRFRARAAKRLAEAAKARAEEEGEEEGEERDAEVGRSKTSGPSPMELSRCSVVRVCSSRGEYGEYGGPPGSAGYWNFRDEELVLYDDQGGGGRRNTWAVLNHEAFHQYIFYFYGNLAPHSWYNEGTGDVFSGYQLKGGRFTLKPFDWRVQTIREAIKLEKYVPLKDLVNFTQGEYYGQNDYNVGGGQNYAQGWSLVYFLRTGKKKAQGWNEDWDSILDDYLIALNEEWLEIRIEEGIAEDAPFWEVQEAQGAAREKAVERAFAGVDWEEMTASWERYTLKS